MFSYALRRRVQSLTCALQIGDQVTWRHTPATSPHCWYNKVIHFCNLNHHRFIAIKRSLRKLDIRLPHVATSRGPRDLLLYHTSRLLHTSNLSGFPSFKNNSLHSSRQPGILSLQPTKGFVASRWPPVTGSFPKKDERTSSTPGL
jgi:hypothetical protein